MDTQSTARICHIWQGLIELARRISALLPLLLWPDLYLLITKDFDVLMLSVHVEKHQTPLPTFVADF